MARAHVPETAFHAASPFCSCLNWVAGGSAMLKLYASRKMLLVYFLSAIREYWVILADLGFAVGGLITYSAEK